LLCVALSDDLHLSSECDALDVPNKSSGQRCD